MRIALALVVLAACGSKTPPPQQTVGNTGPDAAPPPLAAGCPATFAEIPAGASCDVATYPSQCNYPDGSCWCGAATPCSGVELSPDDYAAIPSSWQCTATPPAIRADGCPGSPPSGACGQPGQSCTYGDCCVQEYHCDHGQWTMGNGECPP